MLGFFMLSGLLIGSAIKAGIDNAHCMSKPFNYTTKENLPVYMDRKCRFYVNGERTYEEYSKDEYGNEHVKTIGCNSKKVYSDSFDREMARWAEYDEKDKEDELKAGHTAYTKRQPRFRGRAVTTEMSTGKIIASLIRYEDGRCYKEYLADDATIPCAGDGNPILISEEEFKKLNIYGTHFSRDYKRRK